MRTKPPTDYLPPHDLGAEAAFLGSLLIDPTVVASVCDQVTPDAFYDAHHRTVYEAFLSLWENRVPSDFVTLRAELDKTDAGSQVPLSVISNLLVATPSAAYASYYGEIVMSHAQRRALIDGAGELVRIGHDISVDLDVDEVLVNVRERVQRFRPAAADATVSMSEFVETHATNVVDRWLGVQDDPVVRTGIRNLDFVLAGGFRKKQTVVVGGRPGMAKTSFATHLALENRTMFFSLEMPKEAIVNRLVSVVGNVPYKVVSRTAMPTLDEQERWVEAAAAVKELPIWVNDTSGLTTMKMRSELERRIVEDGIELVVIDHLDWIGDRMRTESQQQRVSLLMRRCVQMAKELDVPVVVLSQLSRAVEHRPGCFPILSDLRDSGTIEQDAEVVIFLYRRRYYSERNYPGVAPDQDLDYVGQTDMQKIQLIVAKNRNGEVATVHAGWTPKTMAFEEDV